MLSRCNIPGLSKFVGQSDFWFRNFCIFILHSGGLQIWITLFVFHTFFTECAFSCCRGSSLGLFSMFCKIILPLPRQIISPMASGESLKELKESLEMSFFFISEGTNSNFKLKNKIVNVFSMNLRTHPIVFFLWSIYILVGWIGLRSASKRS